MFLDMVYELAEVCNRTETKLMYQWYTQILEKGFEKMGLEFPFTNHRILFV